jgi:hypothetical protein
VDCAAGSYNTVVGSVSAGDCQLCEAGKASATPAATSAATGTCEECVAGKYANAVIGASACTTCNTDFLSAPGSTSVSDCCPAGETPLADLSGCKALLLCADDEYMRDEECEKCNNTMSILLVSVSLLSFVAITYLVQGRAQQQSTMIGIKSITAFYQSAQLTTLVSIPWPKIALWTPFTIP